MSCSPKHWHSSRGQFWPRLSAGTVPLKRSQATGTNAELLALSGKRSPYAGKLGVVEQGALADLLLVEGNPLENIKLIADPAKNFKVIMKGGRIYKDAP
jgi:imidazolonepropionase-like amidohydrolase